MKVHLSKPEHGWITVTIVHEGVALSFAASYIPGAQGQIEDSISELVIALLLSLNNVQSTVHWFAEPTEYQFIFSPQVDSLMLTIHEIIASKGGRDSREILKFQGVLYDICHPFWKALRDLQTGQSPTEYEQAWGYAFPVHEMKQLTDMMDAIKQKR